MLVSVTAIVMSLQIFLKTMIYTVAQKYRI